MTVKLDHFSAGLAEISTKFNLCSQLKTAADYKHFLGWIRNAFATLAMVDYPYPTHFLAPVPAYPVKVCHLQHYSTLLVPARVTAMASEWVLLRLIFLNLQFILTLNSTFNLVVKMVF